MSKNPGSKREIIELDKVPRSSIAPKRQRISRLTSKVPAPESSRSDESRTRATREVIASATGSSRGSSRGRSARTPTVERSSEEETVTDGLLQAVERSSREETETVDGGRGSELRIPAVERFSGEVTVTEGLLPAVDRSSKEETATVDGNSEQNPRTMETGIR